MGKTLKSSVLVYGMGSKGVGCPTFDGKKPLRVYAIWGNMLFRCTEKGWVKSPPYIGTSCSENFKSYEYFYKWCHKQVGFGNIDENGKSWHLDKDILVKGNKVYSEDVCVFVPHRINCLLIKSNKSRGDCPIGVSWSKGKRKFMAECSIGFGNKKYLGYFNTEQEAFQSYKTFKEGYVKQIAEEYKNKLDHRVFKALMKYEVNEND